MRLGFPDGDQTILAYCTNVHPVEGLGELLDALPRHCAAVRERLRAERLAVGLWLSRRSSRELAGSAEARARLREALSRDGLEVATVNAFPYGDFHAVRVKEEVYRPDWADPRRYEYTLDVARILSELQPPDLAEATISTLPLGYEPGGDAGKVAECATRLAHLAIDLDRLGQRTGRAIRVCLEPEPGCLIESTAQAIDFFERNLRPAARSRGVPDEIVARHLGVCFDACHHAVQFEDLAESWTAIQDAGIHVGKVQLSCAVEVSSDVSSRAAELLGPFDEPRFLHQVRRRAAGEVRGWMDLAPALDEGLGGGDLRVHFHVPLHWRPEAPGLGTTARELLSLFPPAARTRPRPHFEVETYTWTVLPESLRPRDDATLNEGIARELAFAERELAALGAVREAGSGARSGGPGEDG
jgi:hypothetical protein